MRDEHVIMFRVIALTSVIALLPLALSTKTELQDGQITKLLNNGEQLILGGPNEWYLGSLSLLADGTGEGKVTLNAGGKINFTGTWEVRNEKFYRIWSSIGDENEICETWLKTSANSVVVMANGEKIGVNLW